MKKIIAIFVILIIAFGGFLYFKTMVPSEVSVNGKPVAVYKGEFQAKKSVNKIIDEKQKVSNDAQVNISIEYKKTQKTPQSIGENEKKLENNIKIQVPATIILADKEPIVGLPTKDEAGLFLLKVKNKYKFEGSEEPEFKENITVDNSSIDSDKYFNTAEEALDYTFNNKTDSETERKTYTVKKGDTLSSVAQNNGLSLSAIKSLNPNVKTLKIGQKLNIEKKAEPKAKLTVITRKPQHGIVSVPAPTVRVSSRQIPFGKVKTIKKGVPGKKKVEGYIIFENGKKVREENTYEHYLSHPVPGQVAVGI